MGKEKYVIYLLTRSTVSFLTSSKESSSATMMKDENQKEQVAVQGRWWRLSSAFSLFSLSLSLSLSIYIYMYVCMYVCIRKASYPFFLFSSFCERDLY